MFRVYSIKKGLEYNILFLERSIVGICRSAWNRVSGLLSDIVMFFKFPLILSFSYFGNVKMIKILLKLKWNPNKVYFGESPLTMAIKSNMDDGKKFDIIKLLLDHGAKVNQELESNTPLSLLCYCGASLEIVKLLIDYGADINYTMYDGCSIIKVACEEKRYDVVEYLFCRGVKFKYKDIPKLFSGMPHIEFQILCAIHARDRDKLDKLIKTYWVSCNNVEDTKCLKLQMDFIQFSYLLSKNILPILKKTSELVRDLVRLQEILYKDNKQHNLINNLKMVRTIEDQVYQFVHKKDNVQIDYIGKEDINFLRSGELYVDKADVNDNNIERNFKI